MVVFLAADRTRLNELDQAVRQYLAWKSILDETITLNLDPFQAGQAKTKCGQAEETVEQRVAETYTWLLVPGQGKREPDAPVDWQETRLQGQDALAVRAGKKLKSEELLITQLAGTRLRLELDRIPLWRGDHVSLKQLAVDFAKYLYLPRLKDSDVLLDSVRDGLGLITWQQESFAYADGWDAARGRYRGLRSGKVGGITLEGESLLVKPDVAAKQMEADKAALQPQAGATAPGTAQAGATQVVGGSQLGGSAATVEAPAPKPCRFHGSVSLEPTRLSRDAGKIAEEVVQHIASLVGAQVEVNLEITAEVRSGVPNDVVRTVTENCRTLKFKSHGFETE
jgi:hypothetical protein